MSSIGNEGQPRVNLRVNALPRKLLTHIYNCPEHEAFGDQLARDFGMSRQLLHKHMKRLIAIGLVKKTCRSHSNLYLAVETGVSPRVNDLIPGVSPPHIRTHALSFAYKIIEGTQNLTLKKRVRVNGGYKIEVGRVNGCTIVKHPDKLMVYPEPEYGLNASENIDRMTHRAFLAAQLLTDRYSLTLKPLGRVQKGEHAIVAPGLAGFARKYIQNNGNLATPEGKIDDSEKVGGEVELYGPEDATALLHSGRGIREIRGLVAQLVEANLEQARQMVVYSTHLNAHIPVLISMNRLIKKINAQLDQRKLSEFL